MSQSILGIDLQSTHEIFGCFFKIPFFVAKRSAIEQSIDFLWINAQSMIVRFDRLRPVIFLGFIFERGGQPVIGIRPGHDAHFLAKLASLKIQYKLARQWFQAGALAFHYNIFTVGENAKLRQRHVNMGKLFAKSGKGSPQAVGRHSLVNQLLYGAKADQIAEIVDAVPKFFLGGNEAQAIPIIQLPRAQTHNALDILGAESARRAHIEINRWPSFLPSSARWRSVARREQEVSCPRDLPLPVRARRPRPGSAFPRDSS